MRPADIPAGTGVIVVEVDCVTRPQHLATATARTAEGVRLPRPPERLMGAAIPAHHRDASHTAFEITRQPSSASSGQRFANARDHSDNGIDAKSAATVTGEIVRPERHEPGPRLRVGHVDIVTR